MSHQIAQLAPLGHSTHYPFYTKLPAHIALFVSVSAFLKGGSSDWQGARPGQVPTRRCGDVSLPSAARGSGLAGTDPGAESRLGGLMEGGPGSFQRCLRSDQFPVEEPRTMGVPGLDPACSG